MKLLNEFKEHKQELCNKIINQLMYQINNENLEKEEIYFDWGAVLNKNIGTKVDAYRLPKVVFDMDIFSSPTHAAIVNNELYIIATTITNGEITPVKRIKLTADNITDNLLEWYDKVFVDA